MNIEALTRTVSGWVRTNTSTQTLSRDVTEAIHASGFGQIASLIVPHDHQLAEVPNIATGRTSFVFDPVDERSVEKAARRFRSAKKPALVLDGRALRKPGLDAASRIRAAVNCDFFAPTFFSCAERGAGLPDVQRIPYFPEPAMELLAGYDVVVIAGAHEPVTFFGYPGIRGRVISDATETIYLCDTRQDPVAALQALGDAFGASRHTNSPQARPSGLGFPGGELTAEKACLTLAALQPENAIIVDEGITSGFTYYPLTGSAPPHTVMTVAGGSIGYGMPCATGAAIACPGRPVINLQADGSALYTIQALWTQAREGLHVITLICNNRSYRIVQVELARAGITSYGDNTHALTDIDGPPSIGSALREASVCPRCLSILSKD
jgi:acetolactate synthase-1/2/3 large subunit